MGVARDFLRQGWKALLSGQGRIPALDGLRTLAILMVVCTHSAQEFLAAGGKPSWLTRFPLVQGGWAGVDLFFVLSGYLIGRQLVRELESTGSIRIGRFLVRRGLRIWPLYFAVLGIGLIGAAITQAASPGLAEIWPDLFFLSNYFGEKVVRGGWSLATEEQFYLLAPVLLVLARRMGLDIRKGIPVLLFLLFLAAPILRGWLWQELESAGLGTLEWELRKIYTPFHTHYDGLVAGLLLAHLAPGEKLSGGVPMRWAPLALGLVLAAALGLREAHRVAFNYWGLAWAFGALVADCLARPGGLPARALGWRAFQVSSRLSFGFYLCYRFAVESGVRGALAALPSAPPSVQCAGAIAWVLAVGSVYSLLTYLLVEHPFLRMRERWFYQG